MEKLGIIDKISRVIEGAKEFRWSEVSAGGDAAERVEAVLADKAAAVFDVLGLREAMWRAYNAGSARLRVFKGAEGARIVLLEMRDSPVPNLRRVLGVWSRLCRMFGVGAGTGASAVPVHIVWFAHPLARVVKMGEVPGPAQVNGGYCIRGRPDTIVIYRAEDATRVLIHELLHATHSDSRRAGTVPEIEAETEAWAEVIYGLLIGGREGLKKQLAHAVKQNRVLRDYYGVDGPASYMWRYTVGREDVWMRMGLALPAINKVPVVRELVMPPDVTPMCLTAEPMPPAGKI
jgi:hypothetical protein